MKLYTHLKPEHVLVKLASKTKREVIHELLQLLAEDDRVPDFDRFSEAVFTRESDASTGIGKGIAIPHARCDELTDFVVAVGLDPDGLDFESVDRQPVKVILLIGIPTDKVRPYLRFLAHLSILVHQKGFVEEIAKCKSGEEVVELCRRHEQM